MKKLKTESLRFRVTDIEIELLDKFLEELNSQQANKLTRTDFLTMALRNAIGLTPAFLQPELTELKQTNIQLRSLGQNLNQISRAIHEGKANAVDELTEKYLKKMSAYIVLSRNQIMNIVDHNQKRGQMKLEVKDK